MKKIIYSLALLISLFLLEITCANAQFAQGTNVINVGLGVGDNLDYYGGANETPVFSASFEHGFETGSDWIGTFGIGGALSYQHAGYSGTEVYPTGSYSYSYSWSSTFIGARGTWHPNFSSLFDQKKIDLYLALDLGWLIESASGSNSSPYGNEVTSFGSGLRGGLVAGGRYYFTDNVAGFLELGYDVTADAKLGVAFKFGQ